MTIAAENKVSAAQKVNAVIARQRRLLKRWENVSHYLSGVVSGMYLPGIDQTFNNPVRSVNGRRPPLLTLEGDSLNFTGAISRLRGGKLVYSPIFSYDLTMPYTPRGGGRVLPANNFVLARRANDLLSGLVAYGQRVQDGTHENLPVFKFPVVGRNRHGKIVTEDYSGVLGFELVNPAATLATVSVRRPNPAGKILARHGIKFPMSVGPSELDDLVAEFKAELGGVEVDWTVAVDALLFQKDYCAFPLPLEEAIVASPESVVAAMRATLPAKYQWEASFNDLLTAAKNTTEPLRISRLSALQVFPVETVQDMPEDYAGNVLSPVDWSPPPGGGGVFSTQDAPSPAPVAAA